MRSTFWMYVPSGLPGSRPSFWNCWVRYATAFSSPGVPGARPSIESAARSLMCWSSDAVSMACAAAATAGDVAVVSVKGAELDAGFDESEDAFALGFSVTHPASTRATRRVQLRRVGGTGEGIGVCLERRADWESPEPVSGRQEARCVILRAPTLDNGSRPMNLTSRSTHLVIAAAMLAGAAACRTENRQPAAGDSTRNTATAATAATACPQDNGGLTLPTGFCATIFADSIGHPRHLVVAPNGDVYVNTWSGQYFGGDKGPPGGYIVMLRDTSGDGRADVVARFGGTSDKGAQGGTGIALHGGAVYAEEGGTIMRYALPVNGGVPTDSPATIVRGLPITGDHPMHPFAIDSSGTIYVDLGSASNACQLTNRVPNSPGHDPCTELRTRGGIWAYDANKLDQTFSSANRYATGIRNAVGITIDGSGQLWSTQHGRDQLAENWSRLYTPEQGQSLPAEELLMIEKGADYGWPRCYYDGDQQKLVLAPEYGGDGGRRVGDCASKHAPAAFFPAHWAPDGLLFYTGTMFPARYRNGAFIAFHGSWNRAPGPQGGYQVVFQPLSSGKASGAFESFANGFAGGVLQPDAAKHRPTGLAQGPDGAIYISDDKGGRVWKVVYRSSKP